MQAPRTRESRGTRSRQISSGSTSLVRSTRPPERQLLAGTLQLGGARFLRQQGSQHPVGALEERPVGDEGENFRAVVQRGFEDKTRPEKKQRRERVHRGDECDLTNHRMIANSRFQIGQSFRYIRPFCGPCSGSWVNSPGSLPWWQIHCVVGGRGRRMRQARGLNRKLRSQRPVAGLLSRAIGKAHLEASCA